MEHDVHPETELIEVELSEACYEWYSDLADELGYETPEELMTIILTHEFHKAIASS